MNIQQELAAAQGGYSEHYAGIRPTLPLRHKLAEFAVVNGLANENEALAVVAARYFRMAESERWAGWSAEEEGA